MIQGMTTHTQVGNSLQWPISSNSLVVFESTEQFFHMESCMCKTTCITTYKMTVHVILSYPLLSDIHNGIRSQSSSYPVSRFHTMLASFPDFITQYNMIIWTIWHWELVSVLTDMLAITVTHRGRSLLQAFQEVDNLGLLLYVFNLLDHVQTGCPCPTHIHCHYGNKRESDSCSEIVLCTSIIIQYTWHTKFVL